LIDGMAWHGMAWHGMAVSGGCIDQSRTLGIGKLGKA
jgi:hypothetical protein